MSTSTPAGDSARERLLRRLESNRANAEGSPATAESAGQALAGLGLALQATETAGVASLGRVGAEGAGQPEQQQAQYVVVVENRTSGIVFSQIIVGFVRTGSPNPEGLEATDVGPGQGVEFSLGSCSALQRYIVGIGVGGNEPQAAIPPEGVMTPELSSQLNPSDPGPCNDVWAFVDG